MTEDIIDGLNHQEIKLLNTPLKDLSSEMKSIAIGISDKRSNFIWAENKRLKDEEKKNSVSLPEAVIETETTLGETA